MNSRNTAQTSRSVTTRAVLIALALSIPNSHWLMINWGAGGYDTGQSFPTVATLYFNVIFFLFLLLGSNHLLRIVAPRKQLSDVDGHLYPPGRRIVHRRARHTPDPLAHADLFHLERPAGEQMGWYWFSIFVSWLLKWILFRMGGLKVYRKAMPFFTGLVLGEFMVGAIWTLIGIALERPMYRFMF